MSRQIETLKGNKVASILWTEYRDVVNERMESSKSAAQSRFRCAVCGISCLAVFALNAPAQEFAERIADTRRRRSPFARKTDGIFERAEGRHMTLYGPSGDEVGFA